MSAEETAAIQAAQAVTPSPEKATEQATKPSADATAKTSFRSLGEFRKEAPELYNKFMESIKQSIVDNIKRGSKRVIEVMKKMRKENR